MPSIKYIVQCIGWQGVGGLGQAKEEAGFSSLGKWNYSEHPFVPELISTSTRPLTLIDRKKYPFQENQKSRWPKHKNGDLLPNIAIFLSTQNKQINSESTKGWIKFWALNDWGYWFNIGPSL